MSYLRVSSQTEVLQLKKQLVLSEKKQSQLHSYILSLQQKLSGQTSLFIDLQRLKQNELEIRDVLRLKVSEIEEEKQGLVRELQLTQELFKESEKQIEQLKCLYEAEVGRNKLELSKRLESSRSSNNGSNRATLDQNYKIVELTKQIEIMKQLHAEEVRKIQGEYQKMVEKVQGEKVQLEKIIRLRENERAIINPPSWRERKPSEEPYSKEMEKLFSIKCEEYEEELSKKNEELLEMEEEIKSLKAREFETEEKYLEMTSIIQQTVEELETLKSEKDILEKTLDFSKKIAEEERAQFSKIMEIERENHIIEVQELKQSIRQDFGKPSSSYLQRMGDTKKVCNFILTKLKVIHAFTSDMKKYFQNQQIEMKEMLEGSVEKIMGWLEGVGSQRRGGGGEKEKYLEYEALIQKYKAVLKEKDGEIIELRKSKYKYSQNMEYLNRILVDD